MEGWEIGATRMLCCLSVGVGLSVPPIPTTLLASRSKRLVAVFPRVTVNWPSGQPDISYSTARNGMDLSGVVLDRFDLHKCRSWQLARTHDHDNPWDCCKKKNICWSIQLYLYTCLYVILKSHNTMIMYIHIWSYIIIKKISWWVCNGLQLLYMKDDESKIQQTTHATKGSSDVAERFGWPWVQTDLRCTLLRVGSSFNQQGMLWILIVS